MRAEKKFSRDLAARIAKASPKRCEVILTGSIAKGTFLRDSKDIDIFVLFPRSEKKEHFEKIMVKIVKKAFPKTGYTLSYAEHPYVRFHIEGRKIDLVPAYKIGHADERISAVDRSVLHTEYILRNMSAKQKDDVLLLKKLLKANGLYGAEIKIEGAPGYLCELFILKYQSFSRLIGAVSKWSPPLVIDLAKHYSKKDAKTLREKFSSELVVVDPTDKNRNVAAALSSENLKKFILLCRYFKKNPNRNFFLRKPKMFEQKIKYLKTKGHAYVITLPKPEIVDDVLWGQLKKLMHQLNCRLEKDGFECCVSGLVADDSNNIIRIGFAVYDNLLPKTIAIEGPMLEMGSHVSKFKKRHKGAKFIERSGRIFTITKRKIRTPEESVKEYFKELNKKGKSHLAYPLSRIKIKQL
jgi:tRNA nucleotidyltransferase (CCA-adding enzyme)